MTRFIALWAIFLLPALASSQDGERIATLESEVRSFRREVDERLARIEEHLDGRHSAIGEYGPVGILSALLILDKAGYYIRRKNNGR